MLKLMRASPVGNTLCVLSHINTGVGTHLTTMEASHLEPSQTLYCDSPFGGVLVSFLCNNRNDEYSRVPVSSVSLSSQLSNLRVDS